MRPSSRPSVLERVARGYAAVAVSRVAYGILLIALIPVVTILGILVFGLLGVVVYGLISLFGQPGPPFDSIIGIAWFGGSLLVMFLILRRGHRWLTRLIDVADAPGAWIDPDDDAHDRPPASDPRTDPAYRQRLAAADARHASPAMGSAPSTAAEPADEPHGEP